MESRNLDLSLSCARSVLEGVSSREGVGIVLCDRSDRMLWINALLEVEFPGAFQVGEEYQRAFARVASAQSTISGDGSSRSSRGMVCELTSVPGVVRCTEPGNSNIAYWRHYEFDLGACEFAPATSGQRVHCLVDITAEKKLEETYLNNLFQLASMKEIVDLLYESLSTQEVIYLSLVAVTSQLGFGFNRAFFLEVRGDRLQGRIGIGPSSVEDAHRIWTRLASLNLPTLRSLYEDLTRGSGPPDPQTQEIALRMDFPVAPRHGCLLGAIAEGKPTSIRRVDGAGEVDAALFRLLQNDSAAVVPLFVRQAPAGVLIADNFITKKPITEHHLNLLKTFSGYAGVALEKSQLYDELRESVAKLQDANENILSQQQRLLQAEKLSAIGRLAACVSHEIRNPLVAIGGLARSLLRDRDLPVGQRQSLELIANEVSRLETFLKETLDFVKPEAMRLQNLDIRVEVEKMLDTFRWQIEDREIVLDLDLGAEPAVCHIDPNVLHRALANLIKNAIEALGHGGNIAVSVKTNGGSAVLRLADTGPGIPAALHSQVFEPFFTTKSEGTGLGLAIASQSIRDLGGSIALQADEVYKTIFEIILPLAPQAEIACGTEKGADGAGLPGFRDRAEFSEAFTTETFDNGEPLREAIAARTKEGARS
jgi:signal transduction histidine kinase